MSQKSLQVHQMFRACIRAFVDDPGFAAVVVPKMSANKPNTVDRAQFLSDLANDLSKPICVVWINEWLQGPGSEIYDASPRISIFRSMTRCIQTLKSWLNHYEQRATLLANATEFKDSDNAGPARK